MFIFFGCFSFMESLVFEQPVRFRIDVCSVTSDLWVHCTKVEQEFKIELYMRTVRASAGVYVSLRALFSSLFCKKRYDPVHILHIAHMRRNMIFLTMWYVRPAKSQISLRIRAV